MAVRALKQTGSRNIEAALEYISKMGYLDPRNELIVRVIKQTSPGNLKKIMLGNDVLVRHQYVWGLKKRLLN